MTTFSQDVIEELGYYVYLYSNPETNAVFYVGKGKGNRIFEHLKDKSDSEKVKQITALRKKRKLPRLEILTYGLAENVAEIVEGAVIDALGLQLLTNQVSGRGSQVFGRMTVEQIRAKLGHEDAEISEPSVLIRINKLYRPEMEPIELYEATRGIWEKMKAFEDARYAFAVFKGVIREVYEIRDWFPAGSTFYGTRDQTEVLDPKRVEFVGGLASERIRRKYLYKSVKHLFKQGDRNSCKVINI